VSLRLRLACQDALSLRHTAMRLRRPMDMRQRITQRLPSMSASVSAVTGAAGEGSFVAARAPLTNVSLEPNTGTAVSKKVPVHWPDRGTYR
jgi:hypothetical protein